MTNNNGMLVPPEYHGREQAYVKHTILKTYLERLFIIIGQTEAVINYVDCFAGPWADETEELESTSIGISVGHMKRCQIHLQNHFNRSAKFRALYIEKNKESYARLKHYVDKNSSSTIELKSLSGDYTTLIPEILCWSGSEFTFFFVDPKGWKQIAPPTLKPLLERQRSEFLINLMYEFANRSATFSKVGKTVNDVFGEIPDLTNKAPDEREETLSSQYRIGLNKYYQGRHAFVAVERPGRERTLYFLVYLTRHSRGIAVFKEAAETMVMVQRVSHIETKLRKQQASTPHMDDLFSGLSMPSPIKREEDSNRHAVKEFLLERLCYGPLVIDHNCRADFLEQTNFYPSDFQTAMKELLVEQKVVNLSVDASRRKTKMIKPDWPNKAERWSLP